LELDNDSLPSHKEDDPPLPDDKKTRIVICLSPDSSARLAKTQYLQSDIAFKRIVGFDKFEIAAMDRDANTSELPLTLSYPNPPISPSMTQVLFFVESISPATLLRLISVYLTKLINLSSSTPAPS
jgi:hypothetical protein